MNKPFKRVVYGRWDDCMKVVKKAKMKNKKPSMRLYDRFEISEILDYHFKQLICGIVDNTGKPMNTKKKSTKSTVWPSMMTRVIGSTRLTMDDDIYQLELYKD